MTPNAGPDPILRSEDPEDEAPSPFTRSPIVVELNDRISNDERVDQAMALIADGVTFVRKR